MKKRLHLLLYALITLTSSTLCAQMQIPVFGDPLVCRGNEKLYYVNASPGLSYNWDVTNGTIQQNMNDSIIVLWNGAGHKGFIEVSGFDGSFNLSGGRR